MQRKIIRKTIEKVLIANRGEIARRIIITLKKLSKKSVAVYSDFDINAPHVFEADEAIYIGGSALSQSYNNIENILAAIRKSGADAVHPGYGFMAENSEFVEILEREGITFIGPNSQCIKEMGEKVSAKKIAQNSNVNLIPGFIGEIESIEQALLITEEIGFPIIIKAAAGGGGKGMRLVYKAEQLREAINSASEEALRSFKDKRIFIEKYIERPRHIEIQILGDQYGNIICLGERECSIQRRHQKIIEEAPSPFLDSKMRDNMYQQSINLAKSVGYYSAGTVEYIVGPEKNFYFIEMNTRIQVEHAITELITGIDIVEEMINIAEGQKLKLKKNISKFNGWAFEARVYAEDPAKDFFPTTGFIKNLYLPNSSTVFNRNISKDNSDISNISRSNNIININSNNIGIGIDAHNHNIDHNIAMNNFNASNYSNINSNADNSSNTNNNNNNSNYYEHAIINNQYGSNNNHNNHNIHNINNIISNLSAPLGNSINEGIRIESSIAEGLEVGMFYDPMIIKICSHHPKERLEAIARMQEALENTAINGLTNNLAFLQSVFANGDFLAGHIDTHFIEEHYPEGFKYLPINNNYIYNFIGINLYVYLLEEGALFTVNKKLVVIINNISYYILVDYNIPSVNNVKFNFRLGTKEFEFQSNWKPGEILFAGQLTDLERQENKETKSFIARIIINNLSNTGGFLEKIIELKGLIAKCKVFEEETFNLYNNIAHSNESEGDTSSIVTAPITGFLSSLYVKEDDEIKKGDPLFVIEAMKMQNTINSERSGKIKKVNLSANSNISEGDVILEFYKD